MKRVLVVQLARLGDLIQTKRLLLSVALADADGDACEVHLLTDASLSSLARLLFPGVVCHGLSAHGPAVPGGTDDPAALSRVFANRTVFAELSGLDFARVYLLNHSGLARAVSALFPPETVRGHFQASGQPQKDPWPALAFRFAAARREAGLNLADFWAAFAPRLVSPDSVNPVAAPKGGGLGVVLAGREARRSLPPEVLAPLAAAAVSRHAVRRIALLGTAAQAPAARAFCRQLHPSLADHVADLTGKTDMAGLVREIAGLDALFTPDTGAMHLAAHLGTPVTAFFLSSAWCHETGPYGAGHTVWQAVTPCAPCLESAPCGMGMACLTPFADPAMVRLAAGSGKAAPPAGIVGFRTETDALGVVCRPFAGEDPTAEARAAFRAFVAEHLGVMPGGSPGGPALGDRFYLETDWMLDRFSRLGGKPQEMETT
ncbi:glycosyltransferase family 9 protein [Desulfovibrio sulfodismutans]|uniref:Glycosyltransferase family 9 protein n=1 Tax=Desulfolutivibrio sulfodismutans TaxID=63561 RepID=A0A7K3NH69_9BACT|nr:glycosyltransferase family 9 protein [Desulfolutivibrio sulfodismutans]NDY55540.1 glycosyltransferase family 9 protein [Desulfolutivibrio sulfodismutans]QLA11443.1 ADP-heptose--LPS heptosyltransferase [Desulfolutivibrio sulfodismutans DSM 3696]